MVRRFEVKRLSTYLVPTVHTTKIEHTLIRTGSLSHRESVSQKEDHPIKNPEVMAQEAQPMPEPTVAPLPLTEYKVLSFDVYGSLIEYKAHILKSFTPLLSRLPKSSRYLDDSPLSATVSGVTSIGLVEFLKLFQRHEDSIKLEQPTRRFDEILREIWRRIARDLDVESSEDEAQDFGSERNIANWPTFPGTIEALNKLSRHYKLVALSNIDRFAWSITSSSPCAPLGEVSWYRVFTAEDYPGHASAADAAKLEKMIEYVTSAGIKKEEILHVAQSLGHDHAPAKKLGLSSVFLVGDGPIWGKEAESKMATEKALVGYAWRCKDLREFAEHVDKAWAS